MSISEVMQEIARDHFVVRVSESFHEEGTKALRGFLPRIKEVYSAIDYESISGSLTVFKKLSKERGQERVGSLYRLKSPGELALHNEGVLTLQVMPNGEILVWKEELDLAEISHNSIVYRFSGEEGERFWVDGTEAEVPIMPGYPLLFAIPSFRDLSKALAHYSSHVARPSECSILRELWREDGRVMWKAAPENEMQRSLYYYLKWTLQDGQPDVRQETPVDEKNPVDLEVTWSGSNRIALIEVKWLGKSGRLNPAKITKNHTEHRAKEGLAQLADYLDRTRSRAPFHDRRGYLVIFDARRRRITAETTQVDREDGFYYKDRDIEFQAELITRNDIAPPVRCFCEPSLSAGRSPSRIPVQP
ncbi:hypothetical protein [Streptomyces sp. Tu102]|uniref:hypothetical protein n=1 Tax=Streptomyces sp. Tu102 TaxID=2838019 RepID=UPI001BDC0C78|nr:hypothetical protein [Streptomyces sp. Tu102]MBT1095734.1 hypothetical protein [Streptomyces sp. Tu102]